MNLLIVASHPDDELLCCSTFLQQSQKKGESAFVIVMTSANASSDTDTSPYKQLPLSQTSESRGEEFLSGLGELGVNPENKVFLNYQYGSLKTMLDYHSGDAEKFLFDQSMYTNTWLSPQTYTPSEVSGLSSLVLAVNTLIQLNPQKIIIPSFLDSQSDHKATSRFMTQAILLAHAKSPKFKPETYYYILHRPTSNKQELLHKALTKLSIIPSNLELKQNKVAISKHESQGRLQNDPGLLSADSLANEEFYRFDGPLFNSLAGFRGHWEQKATLLKDTGYTANMSVVIDVNQTAHNQARTLSSRYFSRSPFVVSLFGSTLVELFNRHDIVPIVKHYPGLGRAETDTHLSLPLIEASLADLHRIDLFPYKWLIATNQPFWIMTAHACYPTLAAEPASISAQAQTTILRKQLGFNGLIISDELNVMQGIRQYAKASNLAEPVLPRLVGKTFIAGTDMAIVYLKPGLATSKLEEIIAFVEDEVIKGHIDNSGMDQSIERIASEKRRLFGIDLDYSSWSLQQKIAQRLIVDESVPIETISRLGIGGVYARQASTIKALRSNLKVPPFILAQHEGGTVYQDNLGQDTPGAKTAGDNFETSLKQAALLGALPDTPDSTGIINNKGAVAATQKLSMSLRTPEEQLLIVQGVLRSLTRVLSMLVELAERGSVRPNMSSVSALFFPSEGQMGLRDPNDLPLSWMEEFPSLPLADTAYLMFADYFRQWQKTGATDPGSFRRKHIAPLEDLIQFICKQAQNDYHFQSPKRVMMVILHPDDQDLETLATLKEKGYSLSVLVATNGEAGANYYNDATGLELAELRRKEFKTALGSIGINSLFFAGLPDAFVQSADDAWKKWSEEEVVRRLVWFIRAWRPQVIITPHSGEQGHGQHQALFQALRLAIPRAGDLYEFEEWNELGLYPFKPDIFLYGINLHSTPNTLAAKDNSTCLELSSDASGTVLRLKKSKSYYPSQLPSYGTDSAANKLCYSFSYSDAPPPSLDPTPTPIDTFSLFNSLASCPIGEGYIRTSPLPFVRYDSSAKAGIIAGEHHALTDAIELVHHQAKRIPLSKLSRANLTGLKLLVIDRQAFVKLSSHQLSVLEELVKNGLTLVMGDQLSPQLRQLSFAGHVLSSSLGGLENKEPAIVENNRILSFPNTLDTRRILENLQPSFGFFLSGEDKDLEPVLQIPADHGGTLSLLAVLSIGRGKVIYLSIDITQALKSFSHKHYGLLANFLSQYSS